ncbi:MAG: nucleoid-associated protein [Candidatus Competibacteraceae bacterium]|nr:nucleoid-associated protein [Candidatus Competibacteraceae bacterium]
MLNFSQARITKLSIHHTGNKSTGGKLTLSTSPYPLHEEWLESLMKNYFLQPFKEPFFHHFDGEKNAVQQSIDKIWDSKGADFHKQSRQIATLLYDSSTHQRIKAGEVFIVMFEDCMIEDELVQAIGIFKSENKSTFLKVIANEEQFELNTDTGINIQKLDKGCLVFNSEKEKGYKVCIVDNTSKIQDALYWKGDFLGVKMSDSSYYTTMQYMDIVKHFSEDVLSPKNQVPREDQLHFLKKSGEFFQQNDAFDLNDFKKEVIIEPEVSDAFDEYVASFSEERDVVVSDHFQISAPAVEKNATRFFKSVLKLDKNFHVYVHGNADYIERGFDRDKSLNYYKLYYREER